MPDALIALGRNLVEGVRLAFFARVARERFRTDPSQLVLVVLVSAAIDVVADWYRYGPQATLSPAAVGSEMAATATLILSAALLAWWYRQRDLVLAIPIVVLASFVPVQVATATINVLPRNVTLPDVASDVLHSAVLVWLFAVLVRCLWVAMTVEPARAWRSVLGGVLLALPLVIPAGILPSDPWWVADERDADGAMNPASELVLALQRQLQDDALAALEDHVQGSTDLYFIGFAPDGAGTAWSERIAAARKVLEGHWGAEGRTLGYVNDTATLGEAPMASVSNLREALAEIAAAADPDEDVLMLYLAGRNNADGTMTVSLPPLDLVQLSGPGLRSLLDEAGFAWRVVVISTCAPASFIEALTDDRTMLIANATPGTDVAECARRGEPVAFGDAFFSEALPRSTSLPAAFESARRALAQSESSGAALSVPFMQLGSEIARKLESVRGRSTSAVTARASAIRHRV